MGTNLDVQATFSTHLADSFWPHTCVSFIEVFDASLMILLSTHITLGTLTLRARLTQHGRLGINDLPSPPLQASNSLDIGIAQNCLPSEILHLSTLLLTVICYHPALSVCLLCSPGSPKPLTSLFFSRQLYPHIFTFAPSSLVPGVYPFLHSVKTLSVLTSSPFYHISLVTSISWGNSTICFLGCHT